MKNLLTKKVAWKNVFWELIVVFIGLLSALYVDSLIQDRKDRHQEAVYQKEIKRNLESDIEELEELITGMESNFKSIQKLNMGIREGAINKDSLVHFFGRLIFIKEFRPDFTALDVIKNKGDLDIIKDQQLVYQLNRLREFSLQLNRATEEVKTYYNQKLEPFMLQNFDLKDYVWNDTITIDSEKLIREPYFQNLILLSVQKWGTQLHFHKEYLKELKTTLDQLESSKK